MSAIPVVLPRWMSAKLAVDTSVVVSRHVAPAASYVEEVVARANTLLQAPLELGNGRLVVNGPFAHVRTAPVDTWAATGWLRVDGVHLAKFVRVEVELAEYSEDACAIEVRPVSPNVRRWGTWRYNRYFSLAHRAADLLALRLAQSSTQVAA